VWHDRLWLIDHGAALYLQHAGLDPAAATRPFPLISQHVLLGHAGSVTEAGARLAERITPAAIKDAVTRVPAGWFAEADRPEVYVEYLTKRLADGGFAEEAERARAGG
jgi:hypothetical protein